MMQITTKGKIRLRARWLVVGILLVFGIGITATHWQQAQASSSWLMQAEAKYPTIMGTALDNCNLCHTSAPALNLYGNDFATHSHSFAAIESLDSDGDGYTNLAEINAHTFPGDRNSHPVAAPTSTPTKIPPTPTATRTQVPPTATNTRVPPTATSTPVPATSTATSVPPTATSVNLPPVTATWTRTAPTATSTASAPTATSTALAPTATRIVSAPTATSTRAAGTVTKTPTKIPPATQPTMFRDVIRQLPGTKNQIGNWLVGNTTVHVTSQTKISRDDDTLRVGKPAIVRGTLLQDGSVNATSVTVQDDDMGKRFHRWLEGLGRLFSRPKDD